jgi:hypothetical protein
MRRGGFDAWYQRITGTGCISKFMRRVLVGSAAAVLLIAVVAWVLGLTRNLCALLKRPHVLVDSRQMSEAEAEFVEKNATLNVAGPRARGWSEGYGFAVAVIARVISHGYD